MTTTHDHDPGHDDMITIRITTIRTIIAHPHARPTRS